MAGADPFRKPTSLQPGEEQQPGPTEDEARHNTWKTVGLFLVFVAAVAVPVVSLIWATLSSPSSTALVILQAIFLGMVIPLIFWE